jgi:hypothetical protein
MRHNLYGVALLLAGVTLAGQSSPPTERSLFDGKTTQGWRGFQKPVFPAQGWRVEDGWLKHAAAKGRTRPVAATSSPSRRSTTSTCSSSGKSPGGNSGVKYLVTEDRNGPIAHEPGDRRRAAPRCEDWTEPLHRVAVSTRSRHPRTSR